MGEVLAVCISKNKGMKKTNVGHCELIPNFGLEGDAHSGRGATSNWHRQVSLLAEESINKIKALGLNVGFGDFAENITTRGIDLLSLKVGDRLKVGNAVELEITQFGKTCHERCNIYKQVGDCIMPREGVFAKVLVGGEVKVGDKIKEMPKLKVQIKSKTQMSKEKKVF
ncbi:MAG: MOSC domain-containing protein [Candidatus Stahlbacteria bacterium]|nr:MOSC domain-containing protein [Candidatus Stahlbacteria bacterium]